MIVGVGVDQHAALPHLVAKIYPTAEFAGAIYYNLIPGRRLLFDGFAITNSGYGGPGTPGPKLAWGRPR